LLQQALEQILAPEVWQVVAEPVLVALVVSMVVAAGAGLWLLGPALGEETTERKRAADPQASTNQDRAFPRPADSPLARLRPFEPPLAPEPVASAAPAPQPPRPPTPPKESPQEAQPTDGSDVIDAVFQKAWQGKLVPRVGRARPSSRDLAPPPTVETLEEDAPSPPSPPVRAARRPEPAPTPAPAAEELDRSLGKAWERAFVAIETPAPAGPPQGSSPPAAAREAQEEAPAERSQAEPIPAPRPPLDATDPTEHVRLVELLVARGRLDDAARLAREGLAAHPDASALLLQLSRAEAELGHVDAAIAAAREAHRLCRSRASLSHLLRLLSAARRFTPEDGERLRRAVQKHPETPVLLHAAGVFEATHGNPWAAIGLLRTALRLESDPGIRSEIERELARL
jgi:hypothetical protein